MGEKVNWNNLEIVNLRNGFSGKAIWQQVDICKTGLIA